MNAEELRNGKGDNQKNNAIIVASYGTFSTGINIKNLHNVIFASQDKIQESEIFKVLDEVERGKDKVKAMLYDVADDCTKNSRKNYTLNHFIERVKIYNEERFNYDILSINVKS